LREELYEKVKDVLSREEFETRVRQEMEGWGGLLEEEAAALLVIDELGRNEVSFGKVADLYEGGEAFLRVKVETVGEVREFERQDGSRGRVVNLMVSDPSGRCRLVLWDDEVELVTSGKVKAGSRLRVVDGYVRRGRYGLEVSSGRWGVILPEEP
jgi:replication factor A1